MKKQDSPALRLEKQTLTAWAQILYRNGTIDRARLVRIRHGLYQSAEDADISEAAYLSRLIPEGILCVESALFPLLLFGFHAAGMVTCCSAGNFAAKNQILHCAGSCLLYPAGRL